MASISLYGIDYAAYFDSWFKRIDTEATRQYDRTSLKIDILGERVAHYFLATQSKLKSRCNVLERKMAEIDNVDEKLDNLEEIIGDIDGRLDDVESKIDNLEIIVGNRHGDTEKKLGSRFDGLENRFKALENRMDLHFENTRALSHNGFCTQGWQLVKPVCKLNSQDRWILSTHHPYTVRNFWILKDLSQRQNLAKLLQYYKVQGYEQWGRQHESATEASSWSSGNGSTGERPGLAAAVYSHPDIAHRALAMELGLSYDAIQANMEGDTTLNQPGAPAPTTGARSHPSQGCKRRRRDSTESADSPRMSAIPEFAQPVARRTRRQSTR